MWITFFKKSFQKKFFYTCHSNVLYKIYKFWKINYCFLKSKYFDNILQFTSQYMYTQPPLQDGIDSRNPAIQNPQSPKQTVSLQGIPGKILKINAAAG